MKRFLPVALAAAALLTGPSGSLAATRVVGGTTIHITSAPWVVFIRQTVPTGSLLCTGSILDSLHVLTAAHCLYDSSGAPASITSLSIVAGVSNYKVAEASDVEQDRQVSSLRIHPGYAQTGRVTPDDVAVLALSAPLDLSGPAAAAVSLPPSGATYPAAQQAAIAGFGRETPTSAPDGSLNSVAVTIDSQGSCGGHSNDVIPDDDAVALCAIPASGTACTGDSGSGVVTSTGTPTIIGVVSAGPTGCTAGGATIVTYLGAPEILRFVTGDDHPPLAPRVTPATTVDLSWLGALRAGTTLTCKSTGWQGTPALAYAFVNSANAQVLQRGAAPTYLLTAASVGATISCTAFATNEGGVATLSTTSTAAIAAAPSIGIAPLAPVAAVRGRAVTVRVALYTPSGLTGKFSVCVTPPAQVGARACASQQFAAGHLGKVPFALRLNIRPGAPLGTSRLAISAVAGISSAEKSALVRIARG